MIDATEFGLTGVMYRAGMVAPAGRYRRFDKHGRELELAAADVLPPSFDGTVALYVPVRLMTAQEVSN